MLCPKCSRELPDEAVICCFCGRRLVSSKRRVPRRPNGTGHAFKRGATWTARVVDHYEPSPTSKCGLKPVYKTKGGFRTKTDALNYLPTLLDSTPRVHDHPVQTFLANFNAWKEMYTSRVSESTMGGYTSAFKHFSSLHYVKINSISANDLQGCIDACQYGKRIKQLMKVVAGLVCKYAMDDHQIMYNPAANLWTGNDETTHFEPLTDEEIQRIEHSGLEYAPYIVAMCYLGHRPSEFFAFKKADLHEENGTWFLVGGVKTAAGKGRAVTIPPRILPILQARLAVEGTDLLFPRSDKDRAGNHKSFSQMPVNYFSRFVWKPMMDSLGITGKVPYATRHTYANKLKHAAGDEKDKAGLMGHASYLTTQEHYQTTTLPEKAAITNQIT